MAAVLVIPEVRYFLHLEKRPAEKPAKTDTTTTSDNPPVPEAPAVEPPAIGELRMKSSTILAVLCLAMAPPAALSQSAQCPASHQIVYISKGLNDNPAAVIAAVKTPDTQVLLGPDVDIDFSGVLSPFGANSPLIVLSRCVTLASYQPEANVVLKELSARERLPPRRAWHRFSKPLWPEAGSRQR
jgi:hypothetical protein